MYLGDSSMKEEKTYFLPLLPVWKKKAQEGDKEMAARIEPLNQLPMIKIVTVDNNHGLPNSAKKLFSHGGYKLILTSSESGETIFAIRDVETESKDESGRTIPFLLVITGNSDNDKITLENLAAYASSHLESFSKKISGLFSYDSARNGISFDLATLTHYIYQIANKSNNSLLTVNGEVIIDSDQEEVPLMVLPEGITKNLAIQEQALEGKKIRAIDIQDILPMDNQEKLVTFLKRYKNPGEASIFSDIRTLYILGGAALVGFIIGFIIAK